MELFKILGVCLVTAVLAVVLKQQKGEYALAVALAGGVTVTLYLLKSIFAPIELLSRQLGDYGVNTAYFKIALKALGIGYITGFIADACRDSGQTALAAKAELAGKCAIFLLSVPLISSVFETAIGLLK